MHIPHLHISLIHNNNRMYTDFSKLLRCELITLLNISTETLSSISNLKCSVSNSCIFSPQNVLLHCPLCLTILHPRAHTSNPVTSHTHTNYQVMSIHTQNRSEHCPVLSASTSLILVSFTIIFFTGLPNTVLVYLKSILANY